MHDIRHYQLGETNELLHIGDRAQNIRMTNHMVQQCKSSLHIISRRLDPFLFDTKEFVDAVKNYVLQHRHAKIQIIVFEPETIVKQGHRLLNLSYKLSSFIELRKAHHSFSGYNECVMVVDATGYIHRQNGERYESTLNFKDRLCSTHLLKQFTDMWEQAGPDTNLRNMVI